MFTEGVLVFYLSLDIQACSLGMKRERGGEGEREREFEGKKKGKIIGGERVLKRQDIQGKWSTVYKRNKKNKN